MKKKGKSQLFKHPYGGLRTPVSAAGLIEFSCDGSDYERGKLEAVEASAEKTAAALGRLVQVLFDAKFITYDEVYTIADRVNPAVKNGDFE